MIQDTTPFLPSLGFPARDSEENSFLFFPATFDSDNRANNSDTVVDAVRVSLDNDNHALSQVTKSPP